MSHASVHRLLSADCQERTLRVIDEVLHGNVGAILLEAPLCNRLAGLNVQLHGQGRLRSVPWGSAELSIDFRWTCTVQVLAQCWTNLVEAGALLWAEDVHLPLAAHQQQLRRRGVRRRVALCAEATAPLRLRAHEAEAGVLCGSVSGQSELAQTGTTARCTNTVQRSFSFAHWQLHRP